MLSHLHTTKTALVILSVCQVLSVAQGLQCKSCTEHIYEGEPYHRSICFDQPWNVTRTSNCEPNEYCLTRMKVEDGLVVDAQRRCEDPLDDHDMNTDSMPMNDQCVTSYGSANVADRTFCYYVCNDTDNCNIDVTTKRLKVCSSDCSQDLKPSRGYCDYLTGICACYEGYYGPNCTDGAAEDPSRSCVQCNSETDDNCENPSESQGSPCGNEELYCSVALSQTINKDDQVVMTTITRGCIEELTLDIQCTFTQPTDSNLEAYIEHTCTKTCDSNNCNVDTTTALTTRQPTLHCSQCTSCDDDMPERSLCPTGATHCFSSVEYYITDRNDLPYQTIPFYELVSHVRGCATEGVGEPGCVTHSILGSDAKRVVCQESCQEDGCNDGWPARPACVQCASSDRNSETDCLLTSKAEALPCEFPYEEHCYWKETRIDAVDKSSDYSWKVERGCSYKEIGQKCNVMITDNVSVRQCNSTCTDDGCNIGLFSHSMKNLGGVTTLIIVTLLGYAAQK